MRKVGYARCSTVAQNLECQLGALRAEGCDPIYAQKVSGKAMHNRPELARAIDRLGTGDVLVIASWDRRRDRCSMASLSFSRWPRAARW
jgi:DNA invertase Pin-like site-specific DNA recombinase